MADNFAPIPAPWECPRCKTMNAPHASACACDANGQYPQWLKFLPLAEPVKYYEPVIVPDQGDRYVQPWPQIPCGTPTYGDGAVCGGSIFGSGLGAPCTVQLNSSGGSEIK